MAGKGKTWHERQDVMEGEVIVQAEKDIRHNKTVYCLGYKACKKFP